MKWISFISVLLCSQVFAANVTITNYATYSPSATTNTTFTLQKEIPSTNAPTESSSALIYIPLTNAIGSHDLYHEASKLAGATLVSVADAAHTINIPLTTAASGTQYLYVAAKPFVGGSYKLVERLSGALSGTSDATYGVHPKAICDRYVTECAPILPTVGANADPVPFLLYFFLATENNLTIGDPIDPASRTNGIYFQFKMSNRIYQSNQLITSITSARAGDSRAFVTYDSTATMQEFKTVKVIKFSASLGGLQNLPIGDAAYSTGTLINRDFSSAQSGQITVFELTNQSRVFLTLAFMDKYGFYTTFSNEQSVTPLAIEELLKKQACYIMTAGFGEEHYVTNYFRHYRDTVLVKYELGRMFIKAYYHTAPKYALTIYHSEFLRLIIRCMAYTLYFLFNYPWVLPIFLTILLSCFFLNFGKNKSFLENNRL